MTEHFPAGLAAQRADWWPDVWWVSLNGTAIGAIREIPDGYITRMRKYPEARSFEDAVLLVAENRNRGAY